MARPGGRGAAQPDRALHSGAQRPGGHAAAQRGADRRRVQERQPAPRGRIRGRPRRSDLRHVQSRVRAAGALPPLPRKRRDVRGRRLVPVLIMRTFLIASLICGAAAAQQTDPDAVRIHVLEQRPFTEAGRWEASFFGNTQINPKFTVHAGLSAELAYHLRENLAAHLGVWYFPISVQSSLSQELLTKARVAPETAEAFLLRAAALAGLELMPV